MCRNVITLCLGITLNCLESLYTQPGTLIYSRTRLVIRSKRLLLPVTSFENYLLHQNMFITRYCIENLPRWPCVAIQKGRRDHFTAKSRAVGSGASPRSLGLIWAMSAPSISKLLPWGLRPRCHLLAWELCVVPRSRCSVWLSLASGPCPHQTRSGGPSPGPSLGLPTWAVSSTTHPHPGHHTTAVPPQEA